MINIDEKYKCKGLMITMTNNDHKFKKKLGFLIIKTRKHLQ